MGNERKKRIKGREMQKGGKKNGIKDRGENYVQVVFFSFLFFSFIRPCHKTTCEKRLLASSRLSGTPSVFPHVTTRLPLDGFS